MTKAVLPLTSAQRRALVLLHRCSWATQAIYSAKPFWASGQKIPWNIVSKLLAKGLVKRDTIAPGKRFPNGSVNLARIPIYIICLTKEGERIDG